MGADEPSTSSSVRIYVKLVGSHSFGRELSVPKQGCTVGLLRARIGEAFSPTSTALKLLHKGMALPEDEQAAISLRDGDIVVAMPQRKAPPPRIVSAAIGARSGAAGNRDEDDEPDEPEEPARLPQSAPKWELAFVDLLRSRRCPPWVLEWVVLVRPRRVALLLAFLLGCVVANRLGVGPVFVLGAMIWVIFANLGRRKEGDVSAYSIFNAGVQRLPGQLDADQIDQQIRRGQM